MTKSAVWAATATALSTRPLAASPAAAGRSAATETPCAALATAAVTTSVYLRVCFHTTSHQWMSRTSCPIKTTTGGSLAKHTANLKVMRVTLACARLTAQTDTAARGTSGPRSANQCCGWARCAPSRGRKALMALRSSNAATVPKASRVRCGKMPPPHLNLASTCARRSKAQAAVCSQASLLCRGILLETDGQRLQRQSD